MNRLELVDRVAARNTASKAEVDRIIVSALEEIISAVRCGESVTLIGFGKMDGKYTVTQARHRVSRSSGYGTEVDLKRVRDPKQGAAEKAEESAQ